ncbi:MAG: thiamine pyrophosphate-dependent enzyme [Sulfuritalea sp.]|nr:thiamine pyrophosphate-dependent enzyme [Sulfuritalea sp.]
MQNMTGDRPVILLGEGARGADLDLILSLGVPILCSWQAADMVDSDHPLNFGRPGLYGQRCANRVLFEADSVLALGCRLSIWMVGYEGLRDDQALTIVDVDQLELDRFPRARRVCSTVAQFLPELTPAKPGAWLDECNAWRRRYPWIESPAHDDQPNYISPYRVMERLQPMLKADQIIVTDMGTALVCAFQTLRLKPPQRLMTSGGLGEMGCALPAAIGASFARSKGEVLCLHCDGGMMLNLQELQTIAHHQLPVKIIVFSNDGYNMIKATQRTAGMAYSGTNKASGVSCPDFRLVAQAFGIAAAQVRTWEDWDRVMPWAMAETVPVLVEIFTDPEQKLVPKLDPIYRNGVATSPAFWKLSPIL